ncbi:MAG: hypothetical protein LBQ46_11580 [Treponema sp.]|jgi:hypothetical protein|nr:hypothetical protein [Treponema sp.]
MKMATVYSCWNGLEFLLIRKPELWTEIKTIINTACGQSGSGLDEEGLCCNSLRLNNLFRMELLRHEWGDLNKNIPGCDTQTDFVKNRVAIEVQFGKYSFVAYDLFVKHLAFYIGDHIDVGIEILPMKTLQSQMSSGPSYYEGELYNVVRQGRGVPAVPLVIIGIEP